MRQRITPELVRTALWLGTLTYCGLAWTWYAIDAIRHPEQDPDQ